MSQAHGGAIEASSAVELPSILLLGDERLRAQCSVVEDFSDPTFIANVAQLKSVLEGFRATHGFGRAIAAPQIGRQQRFIALNLGDGPFVIINPVITWRSSKSISMWDDCMSFPDRMVRLQRAASVSVIFIDEQGNPRNWQRMPTDVSELLQHEIDHLDGVLSIDRASDESAIISRTAFEENRAYYQAKVDYVIEPTGA